MSNTGNKGLVVAGLMAAGLAAWYFMKGPGSAAQAAGGGSPSGTGLSPISPSASMQQAVLSSRVQSWVGQNSTAWQQQFASVALPRMTQTDANNLDAIYSYWVVGQTPPADLGGWWYNFESQFGLLNL